MTKEVHQLYGDVREAWAPMDRVTGVISLAASDPDVAGTAGNLYLIPDDSAALRVAPDSSSEVARTLDERFEAWCCPLLGRGTSQPGA
jgi:hypothetical protein